MYRLNWPGFPNLKVYILHPENNEVYGPDNPLPISLFHLDAFEHKYVGVNSVLSKFGDQDRIAIASELLDKLQLELGMKPLFVHGKSKRRYLHLSTFLAFIAVYPYCATFQKCRGKLLKFLMRYPEFSCLDCGFINRDCVCPGGGTDASALEDSAESMDFLQVKKTSVEVQTDPWVMDLNSILKPLKIPKGMSQAYASPACSANRGVLPPPPPLYCARPPLHRPTDVSPQHGHAAYPPPMSLAHMNGAGGSFMPPAIAGLPNNMNRMPHGVTPVSLPPSLSGPYAQPYMATSYPGPCYISGPRQGVMDHSQLMPGQHPLKQLNASEKAPEGLVKKKRKRKKKAAQPGGPDKPGDVSKVCKQSQSNTSEFIPPRLEGADEPPTKKKRKQSAPRKLPTKQPVPVPEPEPVSSSGSVDSEDEELKAELQAELQALDKLRQRSSGKRTIKKPVEFDGTKKAPNVGVKVNKKPVLEEVLSDDSATTYCSDEDSDSDDESSLTAQPTPQLPTKAGATGPYLISKNKTIIKLNPSRKSVPNFPLKIKLKDNPSKTLVKKPVKVQLNKTKPIKKKVPSPPAKKVDKAESEEILDDRLVIDTAATDKDSPQKGEADASKTSPDKPKPKYKKSNSFSSVRVECDLSLMEEVTADGGTAAKVGFTKYKYGSTGEMLYRCQACSGICGIFETEKFADIHKKTHDWDSLTLKHVCKCLVCEYKVEDTRWPDLLRHLHTEHKDSDLCPVSRGDDEKVCFLCGLDFEDQAALDHHFQFHYNNKYKCIFCSKWMVTWGAVKQHLLECKDKEIPPVHFGCPYCALVFRSKGMCVLHRNCHADIGMVCHDCDDGQLWENWTKLKNHIMKVHSKSTRNPAHKCSKCKAEFISYNFLKKHIKVKHETPPAPPPPPEDLTCKDCDKKFTTQKMLVWHKDNVHSGNAECKICGFVAKNKISLRKHQDAKHAEKTLLCSQCGQTFAFEKELKNHMTKHESEKKNKCPVCKEGFSKHNDLRQHKLNAHPEVFEKTAYKCDECDYKCFSKNSLKQHVKKSHPGMCSEDEGVDHCYFNRKAIPPPPERRQSASGRATRRLKRPKRFMYDAVEPKTAAPPPKRRVARAEREKVVKVPKTAKVSKAREAKLKKENERRLKEMKKLEKQKLKNKKFSCARSRTLEDYWEERRKRHEELELTAKLNPTLSHDADVVLSSSFEGPMFLIDHSYSKLCTTAEVNDTKTPIVKGRNLPSASVADFDIVDAPDVSCFQDCETVSTNAKGSTFKDTSSNKFVSITSLGKDLSGRDGAGNITVKVLPSKHANRSGSEVDAASDLNLTNDDLSNTSNEYSELHDILASELEGQNLSDTIVEIQNESVPCDLDLGNAIDRLQENDIRLSDISSAINEDNAMTDNFVPGSELDDIELNEADYQLWESGGLVSKVEAILSSQQPGQGGPITVLRSPSHGSAAREPPVRVVVENVPPLGVSTSQQAREILPSTSHVAAPPPQRALFSRTIREVITNKKPSAKVIVESVYPSHQQTVSLQTTPPRSLPKVVVESVVSPTTNPETLVLPGNIVTQDIDGHPLEGVEEEVVQSQTVEEECDGHLADHQYF